MTAVIELPPSPVPPTCGGIHPEFGWFIGGPKLNNSYETIGRGGAFVPILNTAVP